MDDTIAAISTSPGESGIGIIRISGPSALDIADKIFKGKGPKRPSASAGYTLRYGHIHDKGRSIDEVLLSVMRRPFTYTREDIAEINCHGGMECLKQILSLVLKNGARAAGPGEFTKRAFLNGRIDLIQSEAVCDIIASRTKESLSIAQRQLKGEASGKIRSIRRDIIATSARLEADINFPEEGLPASRIYAVRRCLKKAAGAVSDIMYSSEKGVIFREGATCVICGRPNVGKSSLMNSLLRNDRVIVAPTAGTTRDTIEEVINIRGIPLRIVDTAGIAGSSDEITRASVNRSMQYINGAGLILLVLDKSRRLTREDTALIGNLKGKNVLLLLNKSDLPPRLTVSGLKKYLNGNTVLSISARRKTGLDKLEEAIYDAFCNGKVPVEGIILSNTRHIESMRKAAGLLLSAIRGIDEKRPVELMLIDLKDAADTLGSITGEVFTDDILDNIFSRFCIGK
jgi:tRNA modification GTPase